MSIRVFWEGCAYDGCASEPQGVLSALWHMIAASSVQSKPLPMDGQCTMACFCLQGKLDNIVEFLFSLPQPGLALQSLLPGPKAQAAAAEARRGSDSPSVRLTLRHDYELVSARASRLGARQGIGCAELVAACKLCLQSPHRKLTTSPLPDRHLHYPISSQNPFHKLCHRLYYTYTRGPPQLLHARLQRTVAHTVTHSHYPPLQASSTSVRITFEETLAQALGLPLLGSLPELMAPALPEAFKPPKALR